MKTIQTEVLVIGGGATGTGVLRDLALRGFKAILVERRDLSHGTTGRYHGLLHSGARYAVKDPTAAKECIRENRILRHILPHCLEDTGGFYVITPWDDPAYAERFVAGCRQAGIPVEEVSHRAMLNAEPRLNPGITHCFHVPDASANSFLASELNAAAARADGAQVFTYHEVIRLLTDPDSTGAPASGPQTGSGPQTVSGALCRDLVSGEEVTISADLVVNAAGAWAEKIAGTIGVPVRILPGKGVMVAANQRVVNTVISRCKLPSDGDILVPAHSVAIIGTTDLQVPDPDRLTVEPWEIRLMMEEGEKLVPGFKDLRMLRCWAGVRPLYQETNAGASRDISRAFVLLDHDSRDGVAGLITITSGKWTTYRLMAQVTVDLVCGKLGAPRRCRTAEEPLPALEFGLPNSRFGKPNSQPTARSMAGQPVLKRHMQQYHRLGDPLARVEAAGQYDAPVCECELATYDDVVHAIVERGAQTFDDIRRDARLGMGPCQGGFCTYRAAGIWQTLRQVPVEKVNVALRDFLQERWKGLLPVLWGQQLRQERLTELIYLSNLNADHLPGPTASALASENYLPGSSTLPPGSTLPPELAGRKEPSSVPPALIGSSASLTMNSASRTMNSASEIPPAGPQHTDARTADVIVIGAGFAGLAAAWRAAAAGRQVQLLAKGWGATHWGTGCIDVLGYSPFGTRSSGWERVDLPAEALPALLRANPRHPYALCGLEQVAAALAAFQELAAEAGYPMHGSLETNWLLPSGLGAIRPTCLAPVTMIAGDLRRPDPMLLVGFEGYRDFYPGLAAANLSAQGVLARAEMLELPRLAERRFNFAITLAHLFDTAEFRAEVAAALKPRLGRAARVGFPAVLGLEQPMEALRDLEERLGCPVFEIPGLPPSIGGLRLHNLLVAAIERAGGRIYNGMAVVPTARSVNDSAEQQLSVSTRRRPPGMLEVVQTEAAARLKTHRGGAFVLATGGLLGGGFVRVYTAPPTGGELQEVIFHLPLADLPELDWFQTDFLHPAGHPVYRAGLAVDAAFRPLAADRQPAYTNLYAAGSVLGSVDPLRERSREGIALATGFVVGERLGR